ncbi:hypothetical protein Tco_0553149 [Tanacetum coccineum]
MPVQCSNEDQAVRISKSIFVPIFLIILGRRNYGRFARGMGRDFPPLIASVAPVSSSPALVLDDSCVVERDLSCHVMGRVKDINSIPNLRIYIKLRKVFEHVKPLSYFGGLWVDIVRVVWVGLLKVFPLHVWSRETFGTRMVTNGARLWISRIILDPSLLVSGWSVYTSDDESKHGAKILNDGAQNSDVESDDECNVDGVSETIFNCYWWMICMIDGHEDMVNMPRVDAKVMDHSQEVHDSSNGESVSSFSHKVHNGGSILDILDDMVRVGHSMGYNLDGCLKDMERIIGSQGDEDVFK